MRKEFEQSRDNAGIPRLEKVEVIASNAGIKMPMRFPTGTRFRLGEFIVLTGNTLGKVMGIRYDEDKHCMVINVDILEYGTGN